MSSVPKLPANHVSRVTRLYRHALKNLMNWAVHRDLFVQRGFALRAEFDANKSVTDPKLVELIVSKGEKKLAEFTHPDPYTRELPPSETCRPNIVFAIASLIARDTRCADSAGPPVPNSHVMPQLGHGSGLASMRPPTYKRPALSHRACRSAAHARREQVHAPSKQRLGTTGGGAHMQHRGLARPALLTPLFSPPANAAPMVVPSQIIRIPSWIK